MCIRDSIIGGGVSKAGTFLTDMIKKYHDELSPMATKKADIVLAKLGNDAGIYGCLLYTSDAADEEDSVELGGSRIIKKKKTSA